MRPPQFGPEHDSAELIEVKTELLMAEGVLCGAIVSEKDPDHILMKACTIRPLQVAAVF